MVLRSTEQVFPEKAMQTTNTCSLLRPSNSCQYDTATATPHSPILRELPSTAYQFSQWYELDTRDPSDRGSELTVDSSSLLAGSNLHSPRVREGPVNVTSLYAAHSVMYSKRTQDWKDHRNTSEDWENAEIVNLSYQDLGDDYQTNNLHRCLKRLVKCKHLQLLENSLSDMKRITLPSCTRLNLSRNSFSSLKKLPKAPRLEHLSLADNNITSLKSLSSLSSRYPHLKTLVMRGNPVVGASDYRHKLFKALPSLELADGYPNLPTDKDLLSSPSSSSCSSGSSNSDKCTVS